MSSLRLPPDVPFPVRNSPIFYGWVIWVVSTLGYVMSIPGQTMGMAVFTDHFMLEFELTRTELSIAYLVGTLASSTLLRRAGRFYDSGGARLSMVGSSVGLAVFVVFVALVDRIGTIFSELTALSVSTLTLPLITLGYFGVRFMGQGVLANSSRNVLLVWFNKRRGLLSGAHSVCVTLCFSLAPAVLALLIAGLGWRCTLFILAAVVGLGFSSIALIFVRDTPEQSGLFPDGSSSMTHAANGWEPERTAAEALKSAVFWLYVSVISMFSMFTTAMTFHIVAVFEEAGRTANEAFAFFVPLALVSVATNLCGSWLSDYRSLKPFLIIKLAAFIVGTWGLINLHLTAGYYLAVIGLGVTAGLWGVLTSLFFVRFCGRRHLGEVSGINATWSVLGSAIGPVVFSLSKDKFGSFDGVIWLSMIVLAILFCIAVLLPQPNLSR